MNCHQWHSCCWNQDWSPLRHTPEFCTLSTFPSWNQWAHRPALTYFHTHADISNCAWYLSEKNHFWTNICNSLKLMFGKRGSAFYLTSHFMSRNILCSSLYWLAPLWLSSKESAFNTGGTTDVSLIPGSGRATEEGNGNPLQYSWPGNPKDRGTWQVTVHVIARVGHDLVTTSTTILTCWNLIYHSQ